MNPIHSLRFAVAALVFACVAALAAFPARADDTRSLTVEGRGEAQGKPDLATITLGVGIGGTGSAALSLAYVAAGRFDAMVCRNIKPWDIAAGILIVREAGGFVADPDAEKNPMESGNILATNADLLPQFKDALKKAREA